MLIFFINAIQIIIIFVNITIITQWNITTNRIQKQLMEQLITL